MGGFGSGKWQSQGARPLVSSLPCLSVRRVKIEEKNGFAIPKFSESLNILFKNLLPLNLKLAWTCLSYGPRMWFLCPQCTRRCAFLYLLNNLFRCRKCTGLVYKSQRRDPLARAQSRTDKAARKLDWDRYGDATRPNRMWGKTFERLKDEYHYRRRRELIEICKKFKCLPVGIRA